MKSKLLILLACLSFKTASTQKTVGVEQYYYMRSGENATIVPMAHYTSSRNWYGEARYNYDELETFSLYAGRTFMNSGLLSWSATPVIGGLIGKMTGGSVGLNMDMDFDKLFLSSQSQYSFSMDERKDRFFFSWSELGYQATPWLFGGMAMQQTNLYKALGTLETGYMLGFSLRNWTIPFYIFSPADKNQVHIVMGLNWEWQNSKKIKKNFQPSVVTNTAESGVRK